MYDVDAIKEKVKSLYDKNNIDINKISEKYSKYKRSTTDDKCDDVSFKHTCSLVDYIYKDTELPLSDKESLRSLHSLACLCNITLGELLNLCV